MNPFLSVQLVALAAAYPNDLPDGLILTGFSLYSKFNSLSFSSFMSTIAAEQDPKRFGKLRRDTSYWATQGPSNDEFSFFYFPYYAPGELTSTIYSYAQL